MGNGFETETISDQKRLVRGELWLMVRRVLRARDNVHAGSWRLLTVAGPQPAEEITCIRELMPQAHITAVDIDGYRAAQARIAGADTVLTLDLSDYRREPFSNGVCVAMPPKKLGTDEYDAIWLDLSGPANEWLNKLLAAYWRATMKGGVLLVTFSYGRDVVEAYEEAWKAAQHRRYEEIEAIAKIENMPDMIKARLFFLLRGRSKFIQAILQYKTKMPMLSCALIKRSPNNLDKARFTIIDENDYALAVMSENIGNIYACPQDRILALRRSAIAMKAVRTRQLFQDIAEAENNTAENLRRPAGNWRYPLPKRKGE